MKWKIQRLIGVLLETIEAVGEINDFVTVTRAESAAGRAAPGEREFLSDEPPSSSANSLCETGDRVCQVTDGYHFQF
jgi:hypothetical protein